MKRFEYDKNLNTSNAYGRSQKVKGTFCKMAEDDTSSLYRCLILYDFTLAIFFLNSAFGSLEFFVN